MQDHEENQKDYEIGFLLKEEGDLNRLLGILKQHEAVVSFEGPVKKIALAYEIKKQTSAYFGHLRFTAPTHRIPEIEHILLMESGIIRFLIIKYIPGPVAPIPEISTVAVPVVASPEDAAVTQDVGVSAHGLPLTNEDLEKKIEEILK